MIVEYLKKDALLKFKNSILSNLKVYKTEDACLFDSVDPETGIGHDDISLASDFKNISLGYTKEDDFNNTKLIYNALRELTPFEASNEQFWAYLTHNTFWDYMKKRWSVDQAYKSVSQKTKKKKERDKKIQDFIQERYFFKGSQDRALMRNGISRLWWYGYCSYDETRDDPFELTKILLIIDSDVTQQIVERTFSRNKTITLGILDSVKKYKDENPNITIRPKFRQAMKMLTARSGVNILDFMTRNEVSQLVFNYLDKE